MKIFTLYGLRKPGEEARYIGITSMSLEKRLASHICGKKGNPHKTSWVVKMFREDNVRPEITPYCVGLSKADAGQLEISIIAELRRRGFDLVNLSSGGECGTAGCPLSEGHKRKISAALVGNKRGAGNRGKKHSSEHSEKTGAASRGIKRSAETNERNRAAKMGNKYGAGNRGVSRSVEAKKNLSAARFLWWEKYRQEKILAEMWS